MDQQLTKELRIEDFHSESVNEHENSLVNNKDVNSEGQRGDRLFPGFGFPHREALFPHNNDLVGDLFPVLALEGHHFCSNALISFISFCQKSKCST